MVVSGDSKFETTPYMRKQNNPENLWKIYGNLWKIYGSSPVETISQPQLLKMHPEVRLEVWNSSKTCYPYGTASQTCCQNRIVNVGM